MSDELHIFGAGGSKSSTPHVPVEAAEGIASTAHGFTSELSISKIGTFDLICEGPIDGLVSGEYLLSGVTGQIGYSSAKFQPYDAKLVSGYNVNWLRSVYWNETPVLDVTNQFNFEGISVSFTNGNPNGQLIGLLSNELTISRTISERLRGPNTTTDSNGITNQVGAIDGFAKEYRILNKNCKACIINVRFPALAFTYTDPNNKDHIGDTVATLVTYEIQYKPLFSDNTAAVSFIQAKEETVYGKANYGYIRSTRIDFNASYLANPNFAGWAIKIYRKTPDSLNLTLRNQTYVDSLSEIYGDNFTYPNSALVQSEFSAYNFQNVPTRAFDIRMLRVKVPNNYDPIQKSYTGVWDGEFKTNSDGTIRREWTDNPAWCFYDLLSNQRYGLGRFLDEAQIDKWTLYDISRYCDEMVPDGLGGVEPRFTANLIILARDEAFKVINDMASIFRAITYYSEGSILTSQDAVKECLYQFTNSNVENGDFSYSSTSKKVRHSVAIARYNDKTNFFKPAVEYVEDVDAIKQYGIRELDLLAFGSTSRSQAIRMARWALLSETLETDTINFVAGTEGAYLRPGDLFRVYDKNRKAFRHAGRTLQLTSSPLNTTVILNTALSGLRHDAIYNLSLLTPTFNYNASNVTGLDSSDVGQIRRSQLQTVPFYGYRASGIGSVTQVTMPNSDFGTHFDFDNYVQIPNMVWMIEASGTNTLDGDYQNTFDYYRVIRIDEKEENKYGVLGVQYSSDKYNSIDNGVVVNAPNISVQPPPAPPSSLNLSLTTNNGLSYVQYDIVPGSLTNVISFEVYAKKGDWIGTDFSESFNPGEIPMVIASVPDSRYLTALLPVQTTEGTYPLLENGQYFFRAYTKNQQGKTSTTSAANSINIATVETLAGVQINSLSLQGASLDSLVGSRDDETYSVAAPIFQWQLGLNNQTPISPIGDLAYRITFRKSTDTHARFPATGTEVYPVGGTDAYKPSTVIYYEVTGYTPSSVTTPTYEFDVVNNVLGFASHYLSIQENPTGFFREYDVVVEAHLPDGSSSAGGNINGSRGGVIDSDFDDGHNEGYDILYVDNPPITGIRLTPFTEYTGAVYSGYSFVTDQYYNPEGQAKIFLTNGSLPSDLAGAFVYTCRESFTSGEAVSGVKHNGTLINRSEFIGTTAPIVTNSNLLGATSGFMSVSLYDTLDEAFRTQVQAVKPSFDIYSGLQMSNIVSVLPRGLAEFNKYQFRAWFEGTFGFKFNEATASLTNLVTSYHKAGFDSIEYSGLDITAARKTGYFVMKLNISPAILSNSDYPVFVTSSRIGREFQGDTLSNIYPATFVRSGDNIIYLKIPLDISGTAPASVFRTITQTGTDRIFVGLTYDETDPITNTSFI